MYYTDKHDKYEMYNLGAYENRPNYKVDRIVLKDYKYNNPQDKNSGLSLYEIFITKIYDKFFKVNEGDIVVDIGGNLGLFSYYALCKGAKQVYCFEPSPQSYNCIIENFNLDNLFHYTENL